MDLLLAPSCMQHGQKERPVSQRMEKKVCLFVSVHLCMREEETGESKEKKVRKRERKTDGQRN